MSLVRRIIAVCSLSLCSFLFVVPAADARDVTFGLHGNVSDDADLGVGADVRWAFLPDDPRLALTASFDYYFPEDPDEGLEDILDDLDDLFPNLPVDLGEIDFVNLKYWEANLNLTWDFTRGGAVVPYAGLGAVYSRAETEYLGFSTDEDDFGANVLAGIRIRERVFVEAKKEAGGAELFALSVGVRF